MTSFAHKKTPSDRLCGCWHGKCACQARQFCRGSLHPLLNQLSQFDDVCGGASSRGQQNFDRSRYLHHRLPVRHSRENERGMGDGSQRSPLWGSLEHPSRLPKARQIPRRDNHQLKWKAACSEHLFNRHNLESSFSFCGRESRLPLGALVQTVLKDWSEKKTF